MSHNNERMPHVKRRDFCRQVSKRTGLTLQDSNNAINAVFASLGSDLAHHRAFVQVRFGCFTLHYWPSRKGHTIPVKRNGHIVKRGRPIRVSGRYVPVLHPSIYLKKLVKDHK